MAGSVADRLCLVEGITEAEGQLAAYDEDTDRANRFLKLAERYTDFSELTTPMINEFVDKILVHAPEKVDGERVQEVEIYLNFIGKCELPPQELTPEEAKRQEQLRRKRAKDRERYRQIKNGERSVGDPVVLTCKCCGKSFEAKRSNAVFCGRDCKNKFHLQEAAEKRIRACTCPICGKSFTTVRSNQKYCCAECKSEADRLRHKERRKNKSVTDEAESELLP